MQQAKLTDVFRKLSPKEIIEKRKSYVKPNEDEVEERRRERAEKEAAQKEAKLAGVRNLAMTRQQRRRAKVCAEEIQSGRRDENGKLKPKVCPLARTMQYTMLIGTPEKTAHRYHQVQSIHQT